jgi:hypothetical protein
VIRKRLYNGGSYGAGSNDYATVTIIQKVKQQWAIKCNGAANSDDYTSSIKIDGSSNVFCNR